MTLFGQSVCAILAGLGSAIIALPEVAFFIAISG
jgi:hypothetical protein